MRADLLSRAHLSIVSDTADAELSTITQTIHEPVVVGGRGDLERVFGSLLAHGNPGTKKTLDLIGHSTADRSLLVLGDWVIDATSSTVTAFFRGLADQDVMARLGITAVRLLGCLTADTPHGKWTVCTLEDILGVDVYGTNGLILASYYNRDGFNDDWRFTLSSAKQLSGGRPIARPAPVGTPSGTTLDLDSLPALPIAKQPWPTVSVAPEHARELLSLIRRTEGSELPGLVSTPMCELAFPSTVPGRFHRVEVLLDGELVRVHPPGTTHGIVYPVTDPAAFRELVRLIG